MESVKKRNLIIISLVTLGLIVALWIIFTGGGLLYTPQIAGKIVDAETNKPIPGAMLSTDWRSNSLLDVSINLNPISLIVSDKDGNFRIPWVLKPTFPLHRLEELSLIIYAPGYDYSIIHLDGLKVEAIPHGINTSKISQTDSLILLKPPHTENEYWENTEALYEELYSWSSPNQPAFQEEREYMAAEYEAIAGKYENLAPKALHASGCVYLHESFFLPEYEAKAIKQFKKLISRYPNSKEAKEAKAAIREMESERVSSD